MQPIFKATGSRMIPATSPLYCSNAFCTACVSFHGIGTVSMPYSSGMPTVPDSRSNSPLASTLPERGDESIFHVRESLRPWKCPSNLRIIRLPVTARAMRVAYMVASRPEFTKRNFSAHGTTAQNLSLNSLCLSVSYC
ncbi:hypothetical protein D3C71_1375320 [compost metagenome]